MNRTNSSAIDATLLSNTAALLDWFARNARRHDLDPDNPMLRPWIIAAADCALDVGTNPGGLFVYLLREVAKGDFSKLSGERYDRAKLRLRSLDCRNADADDEPLPIGALMTKWAVGRGISR